MSTKLKHVGFHARRLALDDGTSALERSFAEQWREQNDQFGDTYSNPAMLRVLLSEPEGPGEMHRKPIVEVTQEVASTAATLMQWLGTNVGWAFMESALRRCGYKIVRDESARKDGGNV